jgi:hypothetical protein
MSKAFWLSVALVAVFGFSSVQVMARGGGHGGGHHGGGHHGGGHHGGGHHAHHSGHHSHHHSGYHTHHGFHHHYHHSNWAHHNRPFSRGWYGRHGGAWGYGWGGWGWGNPWAISTFGATTAWLGLEGSEPIYGNYGTVDNVLTSETADEPTEESSNLENENEAAANQNDNQNDGEANNNSQLTPDQIAAARQLAIGGKNDPAKDTAFLPLGVFSIAPQGQAEASALVQLAVSKTGIVRGTYYDLLTDHDQPIRGALDKKSQQVAFTFGDQGKVTFETSLGNLTQAKGGIVAHFENGKTSNWTLARYEHEPTEEKGNDNEADTEASDSDSDSDDASYDAPAASPQAEPAAR